MVPGESFPSTRELPGTGAKELGEEEASGGEGGQGGARSAEQVAGA